MPTSLIGRIWQYGFGTACIIALAACGAADPPAIAPSSQPVAQATAASVEVATAAPATLPTVIPTMSATLPPMAAPKETIMPDQKPTQPISLGRATLQPVPEGAAPANTPIGAAPTLATAPVEIAKADLARRRAVAPDTIRVVEVRDVIWPDRGLGCPQPGMGYNQVQVDGLLIRLESGGQIFEYHSGGSKAPFLCEQRDGAGKPTPASGDESR